MSYIFQAKPAIYDLRKTLVEGKETGWLASNYFNQMQPGDIVYFWLAGDKSHRGLYGWGEITPSGTFRDSHGLQRVAVKTKKVFKKNNEPMHISYKYFKENNILQNMRLMQMAMGTNFLLKDIEEVEIKKLIKEQIGQDCVPI